MANSFQLPSPQALDPYNVETQLARDVGNPLAMLALYRSDRGIAQQGYDAELQNQHAFAQQDLAAKIAEARLRSFTDLAKLPGGVDFAATSGTGLDLGASPESLQAFSGATNLAQNAENFSKSGSGFNSFAQGGLQVPSGMVPGMPGGLTNLGPALVRAAAIRAAASGGGSGRPLTGTVSSAGIMDDDGVVMPGTSISRVPLDQIPAMREKLYNTAKQERDARNAGIADVIRPAPATGGTPDTSAPPSPTTGIGSRVPTNTPAGQELQNRAMVKLRTLRDRAEAGDEKAKAIYTDITRANPTNPAQSVQLNDKGVPFIKGTGSNQWRMD